MKATIIYFIFLCTILFLSCQTPTNESVASLELKEYEYAQSVIIGKSLDTSIMKSYYIDGRYGRNEIVVDSGGFKSSVNTNTSMIVELSVRFQSTYPLFISPGDTLYLEYSEIELLNNFKRISFSGDRSDENDLLLDLKYILKYDDTNLDYFYNCSEEKFLNKIDSITILASSVLQKYNTNNNHSEEFIQLTQNYIDFKIANYLLKYPTKMKYSFKQGDIDLSENYMNKLNSYPLNHSAQLNNISFINYITNMSSDIAFELFRDENYNRKGRQIPDLNSYFTSIDSVFSDKEIVDYLKFASLSRELETSKSSNVNHFFELYEKTDPNSFYLERLKTKISDLERLSNNYIFKDSEGRERLLSEFKNKIVYVDIWATWCGPCLNEKKYFQKLINEYKNSSDNIVFLSISIDTDVAKWKDMIGYNEMTSIQFISTDGFKSKLCMDYGVKSIPRFMIIDRLGKVIEPIAMRPSNIEIQNHLNILLKD